MERLKALCERQLAVDVKTENAAEMLLLAIRHNANQLKECVLEFIALNCHSVMQTEEWKNVIALGPDLFTELLETIYFSSEIQPPVSKWAKH